MTVNGGTKILENSDSLMSSKDENTFYITNAKSMKAFAQRVNGGDDMSGKTVKLMNNIDLGNEEWTPIGQTGSTYGATAYFQGNFDGKGYTISNLKIENTNVGASYAAGLFGFLDCGQTGVIKNINVNGANIKGHHWTGVIAGYVSGTVENCHVSNAVVTCTHANDDACGDKAGVIAGYINGDQGTIKSCTAKDSTVTAGRDAGQIVGAAKASQVTGCSAESVTVSATGDCTGANIKNEVIGRLM